MTDGRGGYRGNPQDSGNKIRETLPNGFVLRNAASGYSYRIVRVLGNGGFGVTYEGIAVERNMRVAIKEFFPVGVTARNAAYAVTVTGDEATVRTRLMSFFKEAPRLCFIS